MDVVKHINEEEGLANMEAAVFFYEGGIVVAHVVRKDGTLGGPRPVGEKTIRRWCSLPEASDDFLVGTDERTLAVGLNCMAWHHPARRHTIEVLDEEPRDVAWPHMVFARFGRSQYAWCVKGDARPTLDSRVFVAPFPNIHHTGQVQMCNVGIHLKEVGDQPTVGKQGRRLAPGVYDMQLNEAAFYKTRFGHYLGRGQRLAKLPQEKLWEKMSGVNRFHDRLLVPLGITLREQLEKVKP